MSTQERVKILLEDVLHLNGRTAAWNAQTPLLGGLAQLDSLAVVEVISAIEKNFNFHIEDDEINADMLATLQSLTQFIEQKLSSH